MTVTDTKTIVCRDCGRVVEIEPHVRYRFYCDDCRERRIEASNTASNERRKRAEGRPSRGSAELTEKKRASARLAVRRGSDHPCWKGDDVGYRALHAWVAKNKERTGNCEWCGKTGATQFANISGGYRRDVADFVELCAGCHVGYDAARRKAAA